MTEEQRTQIARLAQKECAAVLEDAEESDGFKHRDTDSLVEVMGGDDDRLDEAEDYLFECIAELRDRLSRAKVPLALVQTKRGRRR